MAVAKWIGKLFNYRGATPEGRHVRGRPPRRRTPRAAARPGLEALEDRLVPAPLVVNSAANSGVGTLRDAINTANRMSGLVVINFAIGARGSARTINLTLALPTINATVLIDGTSQGGSGYSGPPLIELNGAGAGASASGLDLTGNNSTIQGLFIDRFAQDGILLRSNAAGNTIGGAAAGTGNVISANGNDGIELVNPGTVNNLIVGNFIGTNAGGTAALPNKVDGILIRTNAGSNTVGGTAQGAGNVISGNGNDGVEVVNEGTTNNLIQGNFIGTNLGGTAAIANKFDGILIRTKASDNTVGGTAQGAGNVISGNGNDGVEVVDDGTKNNLVQGNFIGTNLGGTAAVANKFDGVLVRTGAVGNTVGGTSAGARNVISGNGSNGVEIVGSGTTGNLVQGNTIGAASDGVSALGNGTNGVAVRNLAGRNTIGGTPRGAGNVIAFNGGDGVLVGDTTAGITAGTGNAIQGNSIFGNRRLGIFLGYDNTSRPPVVLINDSLGHPGVNNSYQNYPVLNTPQVTSNSTVLSGTISSPNNARTTLRIEFFANSSGDPSGYGQGQTFLGAVSVTTDANGRASFSLTLTTQLASGLVISATATDANGNTSEFAKNVTVP
jgi:titin